MLNQSFYFDYLNGQISIVTNLANKCTLNPNEYVIKNYKMFYTYPYFCYIKHVSITIYGNHHHKYFTYNNLKKFVVINYRQIYVKYLHEDIVHNYKFARYNLNENRETLKLKKQQ